MLTCFVISRLTDRVRKKRLISIFGIVITLGVLIGAFTSSMVTMILSIFIFGIGASVVNGTMASALLETNPQKSSKFSNMTQIFYSIGAVISPILFSALIGRGMNWRGYFLIASVLYAVATILFITCPYRGTKPLVKKAEKEGKKDRGVFCVVLIMLILSIGMYGGMENTFISFIKSYFIEELNGEALAGIVISTIWLSMIPTRLIAARIHRKKGILAGICFAGCTVASILLVVTRNLGIAFASCILFGLSAGPAFPVVMSIAMDAFPSHTGEVSILLFGGGGVFETLAGLGMGVLSDSVGVGEGYFFVAMFAAVGTVLAYCAWKRARKENRIAN